MHVDNKTYILLTSFKMIYVSFLLLVYLFRALCNVQDGLITLSKCYNIELLAVLFKVRGMQIWKIM